MRPLMGAISVRETLQRLVRVPGMCTALLGSKDKRIAEPEGKMKYEIIMKTRKMYRFGPGGGKIFSLPKSTGNKLPIMQLSIHQ